MYEKSLLIKQKEAESDQRFLCSSLPLQFPLTEKEDTWCICYVRVFTEGK